jgi:hypothetical protein
MRRRRQRGEARWKAGHKERFPDRGDKIEKYVGSYDLLICFPATLPWRLSFVLSQIVQPIDRRQEKKLMDNNPIVGPDPIVVLKAHR